MTNNRKSRQTYQKPLLIKLENVKDVTFECVDWQCSVTVPPPPPVQ